MKHVPAGVANLDAIFGRELQPAGGRRIVERAVGDRSMQGEHSLGGQRLILYLADVAHCLIVVRNHPFAQLAVEQAEVDRLRTLYELRQQQMADLYVRAGMSGVLQQVPLEEGQRITTGANLARVGDPTVLKAELRIAETQAKGCPGYRRRRPRRGAAARRPVRT